MKAIKHSKDNYCVMQQTEVRKMPGYRFGLGSGVLICVVLVRVYLACSVKHWIWGGRQLGTDSEFSQKKPLHVDYLASGNNELF